MRCSAVFVLVDNMCATIISQRAVQQSNGAATFAKHGLRHNSVWGGTGTNAWHVSMPHTVEVHIGDMMTL